MQAIARAAVCVRVCVCFGHFIWFCCHKIKTFQAWLAAAAAAANSVLLLWCGNNKMAAHIYCLHLLRFLLLLIPNRSSSSSGSQCKNPAAAAARKIKMSRATECGNLLCFSSLFGNLLNSSNCLSPWLACLWQHLGQVFAYLANSIWCCIIYLPAATAIATAATATTTTSNLNLTMRCMRLA